MLTVYSCETKKKSAREGRIRKRERDKKIEVKLGVDDGALEEWRV